MAIVSVLKSVKEKSYLISRSFHYQADFDTFQPIKYEIIKLQYVICLLGLSTKLV